MNFLLGFFSGPAQLKALLIGALAMALVCSILLAAVFWYRGEAFQARGERDLARAQVQVLAKGVESCNAGVAAAKTAAAGAVDTAHKLLTEARRLHAGGEVAVKRWETMLRDKPPVRTDGKPAGCDDAWDQVERAGLP